MMTKPISVIAGGTHADGLTANSLVIIPDAAYIELISFTHPESHYPPSSPNYDARHRHPFANKESGWVAYAFLGAPGTVPPLSTWLNERLQSVGSAARYAPEAPLGRKRPDGVEIRAEITMPTQWAEKEGACPCRSFVAMSRRASCGCVRVHPDVPTQPASNTKHPNGALGIAHLRLLAPPNAFAALSAELTAITGEAPIENSAREHVWLLDLPGAIVPKWHPRLMLCEPDMSDEAQARFVRTHGAGLFELGYTSMKVVGSGDSTALHYTLPYCYHI
ncbi:hypothetical protein BJV78DRAFT_1360042 [Lactifluus subvellereus]|nr:hypothetical protein BJV78DRAFT_1360042 [Lactifluus subvellereus]